MLERMLDLRCLPDLLSGAEGRVCTPAQWRVRREELLEQLAAYEYGREPTALPVTAVTERTDEQFLAGKAVSEQLTLHFTCGQTPMSFPLHIIRPRHKRRLAYLVVLSFRPDPFDRYLPAEEIIDRGFGIALLHYTSVAGDNGDFCSGIGPLAGDRSAPDAPGKLSLWAWAASRTADHLLTRPETDAKNLTVIGHSRLGKTALLCGARDERFAFVVSNESGCGGAALFRGKQGETIADITRNYPFWFCPRFAQYAHREAELPFDQHALLALTAPRRLLVGSAREDLWADPAMEFCACRAASPVWELYGLRGLISQNRLPVGGESYPQGSIAYHKRCAAHFLSRTDWCRYLDYISAHLNK